VTDSRAKTLITADELAWLLDANKPVVLLDVIDEPGATPDDRRKIPGALSVDLATDFSGKPTPEAGRRPLPDISVLQSKARAWGISSDSAVVVYDNAGGAQASRAWWTLRWTGIGDVRLLDDGLAGWIAAGRSTSDHLAKSAAHAGDVVLSSGHMPTINADEAAHLARQSRLFDARPRASYVGEPGKPGTGHIPGAIHAASAGNIADGKFKSNDELRARLGSLGADGSEKVGVYCGSGNAAAHAIAAMNAAGLDAALYVGSWSAWSADPSRPVATGPEPN
jgi:thiosulfate/3-mercaptopyruvate sulfurtransferase